MCVRVDQVFAFDAVSYFLQAFAGETLLIFPVVYGFTNSAPFNTWNIEFALYFFPFIITGVLPTVAALGWQKTPSAKVNEKSAGCVPENIFIHAFTKTLRSRHMYRFSIP